MTAFLQRAKYVGSCSVDDTFTSCDSIPTILHLRRDFRDICLKIYMKRRSIYDMKWSQAKTLSRRRRTYILSTSGSIEIDNVLNIIEDIQNRTCKKVLLKPESTAVLALDLHKASPSRLSIRRSRQDSSSSATQITVGSSATNEVQDLRHLSSDERRQRRRRRQLSRPQ